MHPFSRGAAAGALSLLFAGQALAAAEVTVSFKNVEQFTDASQRAYGTPRDVQRTLEALTAIIQKLGTSRLGDGQTLAVEISNVDLAGQFLPSRGAGDLIRVLRDQDWPRIDLSYTLTTPGAAARSGQQKLVDINYLQTARSIPETDPLRFEKRLLERWFDSTFGADGEAAGPR